MTVKEKADKMRTMTDEELVAYVENRVRKAHSEGFNIGANIKYSYSDDLLTYIDGIYTIIRKMGRR